MALWESAPLPVGFSHVWSQELRSIAELHRLRLRLRLVLTGSPTVVQPDREHWSERLVLVVDEIVSNGLRHGGIPVVAGLARRGDEWLIAVGDHSDAPPTPARGRDPSLGGFGLYLIADLAVQHGWCAERGAKTVWAVVRADPSVG